MVDHINGRAFLPSPKGQGFTRAYQPLDPLRSPLSVHVTRWPGIPGRRS
jgi:hypothetical protein